MSIAQQNITFGSCNLVGILPKCDLHIYVGALLGRLSCPSKSMGCAPQWLPVNETTGWPAAKTAGITGLRSGRRSPSGGFGGSEAEIDCV